LTDKSAVLHFADHLKRQGAIDNKTIRDAIFKGNAPPNPRDSAMALVGDWRFCRDSRMPIAAIMLG
jgi:hypothetical protein